MSLRRCYSFNTVKYSPKDKSLEVIITDAKTELMVTRKVHFDSEYFQLFKKMQKGTVISCMVDSNIRNVKVIKEVNK